MNASLQINDAGNSCFGKNSLDVSVGGRPVDKRTGNGLPGWMRDVTRHGTFVAEKEMEP